MIAQGGECHVVNTSSLAGLVSNAFSGPYNVSKFAALGLSESLAHDLAATGASIGASVLVPGSVNTRIAESTRNRPRSLGAGVGAEDAAFVGGFATAAKLLGRSADLVMLDMTDPQRPRARALSVALARIVRARAINPRFIAGQMRHGPRGAAELAETVDRLVAFAATTDAVASELFDLLHDAYVADPDVCAFLLRENPQAAAAIAERLEDARRRGFWHPRRNDVDASLAALGAEAVA